MSFMNNKPSKGGKQYYPKNRKKYKGSYPIQIRSSYEDKFCKWCDDNDQVLYWASEPVGIPYYDRVRQKNRRYYPDFLITVIDKISRRERIWLVEIKPYKECIPPVITSKSKKSKKTKLYEKITYETNKSKWISAQKYCKQKGWVFKLITERELF